MPRLLSTVQIEEVESYDVLTDEDIVSGLKRLARIKNNLRQIRLEIKDKILDGITDCRTSIDNANASVGELNAILTGQSE